jgi:putative nucleotidyltransferase with HDIG domain
MKNMKKREERKRIKRERFFKFFISFLFILVLTILYPQESGFKKVYFKTGEIVPYDIISPFEFKIPKKEEEIKKEEEAFISKIKPYIFENPEFKEDIENIEIKNFISKKDKEYFMKNFKELYKNLSKKIIVEDKEILKKYGEEVVLIGKNFEKNIFLNEIMDMEDVKNTVREKSEEIYPHNPEMQRIFYEIFLTFFKPNYNFDEDFIKGKIEEAKISIFPYKEVVLKGEKIIGAHEKVTPQIEEKLQFLEKELKEKKGEKIFLKKFYIFLLFSFIFLIFYYITRFYFKRIYGEISVLLAHFINLFLLILLSHFFIKLNLEYYFVPLPFLSIISGIISPGIFGIFVTILGSIYLSTYFNFSFLSFIFFLFTGTLGVFLARFLKNRTFLYFSIMIIFFAGSLMTFLLSLTFEVKYEVQKILIGNLISGIISISFLMILLPFYERFFGITTDFVLMELLNLNHPLLIELQNRAPGTFAHSTLVANLAENGSRILGANPLIARVGAYFHDIGKLENPLHYAENQTGENPHDKLSPKISALIVKKHVKYGVQLAIKYKLPKEIINIIRTHHGTTVMIPFYEKAKIFDKNVSEDEFRYPGPKPKTKEEAIVMLADTVEATVRSLGEVNPLKIRETVSEMFKRRFMDGQLDESEITRRELDKLEDAFIPLLISYFCQKRPEYKT